MPDGPWPATGAVLAAIETAAGRTADRIAGKPEPPMYEAARDRLGEGRCLAVGDRLEIDVLGARRAGMDSALVLTGGVTRAQADAADPRAHPRRGVARGAGASVDAADGPRPLPDRQPDRRRRPRREAARRRRGRAARHGPALPRRAHRPRWTTRASARAAPRPPGEIVAAMGGDGLTGAVAGELRDGAGVLAVLPGGRGNDFARKLGIPADPVAACALLRGAERRIDLAAVDGRTYLGILSAGPGLRRQPAREREPAAARHRRSTPTRRCARSPRGSPRAGPSPSTVSRTSSTGTAWPCPTPASTAAACTSSPTRGSTTACSTSCSSRTSPSAATWPTCPRCSRAPTWTSRASTSCAAARVSFHADRPFTAYADGDPIAELPATVDVVPGTLRVLAP